MKLRIFKSYIKSYSDPVIIWPTSIENIIMKLHMKSIWKLLKCRGVCKLTLGFDDGSSLLLEHLRSFPGGVGILSKYDPRTRSWYQLGKNSSGLKLSDVFATKQVRFYYSRFTLLEGGVIASDVRLTHLQTLVEGVDVGDGSVGLLVDQKGMVLASTTEVAVAQDKIQDIDELSAFSQEMLSNDRVIEDMPIAGSDNIVVSTRIELEGSEPWYLMIAVQKDIAFCCCL